MEWVMRLSRYFIPTLKEIPADAVVKSHQIMLRAGLIRPLAAGIYSYLPLGWRVMRKVIQIIREEMDAIGAQEFYLPALNPIEIWEETKRASDFGEEMFRFQDRKNRTIVLAPTHEEIICDIARGEIRSYKDLPQIWYQIQTKFRDEPRPRSGVLRARQFIMKDSYSLDVDEQGLDKSYQLHAQAYKKIFSRCGLKFFVVGASTGLMGGSASQEFMLESEVGEDVVVICDQCGYAANIEVATGKLKTKIQQDGELTEVYTPDKRTIEQVSQFLNVEPNNLIKSLMYVIDGSPVMILIRGDYTVNESKMMKLFGNNFRPATEAEVAEICGAKVGFIGPIGLIKSIPIYADNTIKNQRGFIVGANKDHYHLKGVDVQRDIKIQQFIDVTTVNRGDGCPQCDYSLRVVHAIELGHIFKLGTKYSKSMGVTFLDATGQEQPIVMGSYGIGIERIIAAFIEQHADARGIIWNKALAPFLVHLIPINYRNQTVQLIADKIYHNLEQKKIPTLLDDREVSPGFKFKDADLLGMPIQIIIGEKNLKNQCIELKLRKTNESFIEPLDKFETKLQELLEMIE